MLKKINLAVRSLTKSGSDKLISEINKIEFNADVDFQGNVDFRRKTLEFKDRYKSGESLEDILPEAFALCRLAAEKILGLRHYDVQLAGGITLFKGQVAEINTGEGKTLIATLPAYLNSLTGRQVHVVTVNDYLAQRDCNLMAPLYNELGISVDHVTSSMDRKRRREAYKADILYITSNELGFDYLRDNMAKESDSIIQRGHYFAIIDEVDSILIDDARTPLIISGQSSADEKTVIYMNSIVDFFSVDWVGEEALKWQGSDVDVYIDEKHSIATLTEKGFIALEGLLVKDGLIEKEGDLYHETNIRLIDSFSNALKAKHIYRRNKHYIVGEGKVKIVNQSTGRVENGRRWSGGLHQALEAKEHLTINPDNQTIGTISLQNYFRMYDVLSGMSGTSLSEKEEFESVYGIKVVKIPTHKPNIRVDYSDLIYPNNLAKLKAILKDIKSRHDAGQPVLVGTASIEESESISAELSILNIPHKVLTAKHHDQEAYIVAEAGKPGAVTIATNMAGRGTDILLGGSLGEWMRLAPDATDIEKTIMQNHWKMAHLKVLSLGGLHVIGTERNESRRVDDQLKGRAGRQGDPGSSRFYLSFEDRIFRVYGSDKQKSLESHIALMGYGNETGISHPFLDKAIIGIQRRIEGHHFSIRKDLLKYDDVLNSQRIEIYAARKSWLFDDDCWGMLKVLAKDVLTEINSVDELHIYRNDKIKTYSSNHLAEYIQASVKQNEIEGIFNSSLDEIEKWENIIPLQVRNETARSIALHCFDAAWARHLQSMESLRSGIELRSFASKTPAQEYARDGYHYFEQMLYGLKNEIVEASFRAFNSIISANQ